jgi:hypothetical protein
MVARAVLVDRIAKRARGRALALGVWLAGLALVSAACGGSAGDPSVASLGTTTSTTGAQRTSSGTHAGAAAPSFVPYASCLTAHGIAASSPQGHGIAITGNVDPNSPQFAAAQKACRKLAPPGGPKPLTAAQQALRTKDLVAFSHCVRTHGVPGFPDPDPNSEFAYAAGGERGVSQLASPLGKAAFKACQSLFPKLGPQISLG